MIYHFQGFFLPSEFSLDLLTIKQQQPQDPILKTAYPWLKQNEQPQFLTPLIFGTPFLYVFYESFSQLYIDDSTNIISRYTKNKISCETHSDTNPNIKQYSLNFAVLSKFSKLLLTNFTNIVIQVIKLFRIHFHNFVTFHSLTVSNVNAPNTPK